jgi:membrane protein DedA with SNARE-associated domain
MCLLSKEKVEKAEKYFDKHGKSSTFIGRLVPGIRQLISIPAGLAKMNLISFVSFTALGAFIWNIMLAVLGYIGHGNKDLIDKYSHELSYILLGLGALFVIYLIYKGLSKKKQTKA